MEKIEKLRCLLSQLNCDAAILTSYPSILYFSGFNSEDGYLFITKDEQYVITDSRYTLQVKEQSKEFTHINGSCADFELISPIVEKCNIKSIAFENKSLTVANFEQIKKSATKCDFIPLDNRITEIRRTKTEKEVNGIISALQLSEYALEKTINEIHSGMTEVQVAAILESYMRSGGAEKLAFDTVCASGYRSALPHGIATNKVLENGDFLTLDFGCVIDGYCSDITRTFAIGTVSDLQKEIYDTVLKAQLRAEKMITPGTPASNADAYARDLINKKGYGINFGHSLGHGVGIQIHELPNLSPRSNAILSKGDIITIEPGIYIENFGGVRIEDMAYVGENDITILTKFPKELIVL